MFTLNHYFSIICKGDLMKQINKIKGYEEIKEFYYVNEKGQVFSFGNFGGKLSKTPRELKQYEKTGGYMNVALCSNNKKTRYIRVNRLVASAFIDNPKNKGFVHHKDENKKNNNVNNLAAVARGKERSHKGFIFSYKPLTKKRYSSTTIETVSQITGSRVHSSEWKSGATQKNKTVLKI